MARLPVGSSSYVTHSGSEQEQLGRLIGSAITHLKLYQDYIHLTYTDGIRPLWPLLGQPGNLKNKAWKSRLGVVGQPGGDFSQVRLSPDGKCAVLTQPDSRTGNRDLWIMDLERGVLSQLTTNPANDWHLAWSPDGSRIAFSSDPNGRMAIFVKPASGGAEELIAQSDRSSLFLTDWSLDGHWLVVFHGAALGVLKIDGDRKPHDLPASGLTEYGARFSPNGQMLAYLSNESRGPEVYVRLFVNGNATGAKWRVSKDGGVDPVWNRDGKELFYLNREGQLVSVEIRGETALQAGATNLRPPELGEIKMTRV